MRLVVLRKGGGGKVAVNPDLVTYVRSAAGAFTDIFFDGQQVAVEGTFRGSGAPARHPRSAGAAAARAARERRQASTPAPRLRARSRPPLTSTAPRARARHDHTMASWSSPTPGSAAPRGGGPDFCLPAAADHELFLGQT